MVIEWDLKERDGDRIAFRSPFYFLNGKADKSNPHYSLYPAAQNKFKPRPE